MKKMISVLLVVLMCLSPLSAGTHKIEPPKSYIGLNVGYDGVRDSLIMIIAKVFGLVMAEGITGGHAEPGEDFEIVAENALAMNLDTYFEVNKGFSVAASAGCSLSFMPEGIAPAPYADLILYGRLPGGPEGDFLLGGGIGVYSHITPTAAEGWMAPLLAMRYQLDVLPHMGWWIDCSTGWAFLKFDDKGIAIQPGITIMNSVRTGLSYAF